MAEDQWAEKISAILHDTQLMVGVAGRASESVAQRYTWDVLAPRFVELYQQRLDQTLMNKGR